ncbi:MAG: hypothetical protein AB8G99_00380 [Planctomycetaceae bacterium]
MLRNLLSKLFVITSMLVGHIELVAADTFVPDWTEIDVTDELQQAIYDSPLSGRTIVLQPRLEPYVISNTIAVPFDRVSIVGVTDDDGDPDTVDPPLTTLMASEVWEGDKTLMIAFLGGRRNSIEDLMISGNAELQDPPGGQYGVLLAGTRRGLVRNLHFSDIGRSTAHPGGCCVLLTAVDDGNVHPIKRLDGTIFIPEPFGDGSSGVDYDLRVVGEHCQDNTVEHCVFDDLSENFEMQCSFGVRISAPWRGQFEHNQFRTFARRNKVLSNTFSGYFDSALEIGGSASRYNYVAYNHFVNTFKTAMEADRGASYNDFEYNLISDHWTMRHLNGLKPGKEKETRCFAIRDQGFREDGVPTRFARGNSYRWNHAESIHGWIAKNTGFILLNRSIGVTMKGNTVGSIGAETQIDRPLAAVVMDHVVTRPRFARRSNEIPTHDRYGNELGVFLELPGVETKRNGGESGFVFRPSLE